MYTIVIDIPAGTNAIDLLTTLRQKGFSLYYKHGYLGWLTPIAHGTEKVIQLNEHIEAINNATILTFNPFELLAEINETYPKVDFRFDKSAE